MQSMRHDEAFMPYTQVPHTSHRFQIIQFSFFPLSFPVVADDVFQLHGGKSYCNWGRRKYLGATRLIIPMDALLTRLALTCCKKNYKIIISLISIKQPALFFANNL